MAHTTITGTLGKDPQLHEPDNGATPYARLRLAWSERHKDKTGTWTDGPTTWISVTVFGRQAHNVAATLRKGMHVVCTGQLRTETWSSDQGEQDVVTLTAEIVAPTLFFQVAQVDKDQPQAQGYDDGY